MRAAWCVGMISVASVLAMLGCPSIPDFCDNGVCDPLPDAGLRDGGEKIVVPEGCDVAADPHSAPACSVDSYVVYVSASAKDNNEGTRAKPVKTIAKAMTLVGKNRPRVYVCAGEYAEAVKVTQGIVLAGGFDCMSWEKGGETHVAPSERGEALRIADTDGPSGVWDMRFTAKDGVDPGESSVAGVVSKSAPVSFTRVTFEAGKGVDGKKGDDGAAGEVGKAGNAGVAAAPGPKQVHACVHGSSTGGAGGAPQVKGENGSSDPVATPNGFYTSAGGKAFAENVNKCESGFDGPFGSARAGGAGSKAAGSVKDQTWAVSVADVGEAGNPGGGGGGGGGGQLVASGGGGAGGCGGAGGAGGMSGGSSIGLLVHESSVSLTRSSLRTSAAGAGGAGGAGGTGGTGGTGGAGAGAPSDACPGGQAGHGAGGSGGGGGAGGISVGGVSARGVLSLDTETTNMCTTGTAGSAGGGGAGGLGGKSPSSTAPSGNSGGAGTAGISQTIYEIQ